MAICLRIGVPYHLTLKSRVVDLDQHSQSIWVGSSRTGFPSFSGWRRRQQFARTRGQRTFGRQLV